MITIAHSHAEGTVVHGIARGDGTNLVIKNTRDGWRFSRHIGTSGAWYLPRSRDRHGDQPCIDRLAQALRAGGYQVDVHVDNTRRAAADVEADRAEHVAGRVERYDELADARHTRGDVRLDRVREQRSHIPLGQPVISNRYANYLKRLHRTEDSAHAEIAAGDRWSRRAEAAESTQRYRHNPRVMTRRIEVLEAERRGWQRRLDDVRSGGRNGEYADGGQYARHAAEELRRAEDETSRLDDQLGFWRGELIAMEAAGLWRAWAPEHFRVGDEVRVIGTWYPVLRVNRKSVTISPLVFGGERRLDERGKDTWTDTASYDKIHGRRRDGDILHSPPPPPEATCTEHAVVPALTAEFIPERDGGPCPNPPVVRLTIQHDGTSCGCGGLCLTDEDGDPVDPWNDVRLWCAGHLHQYETEAQRTGSPWPTIGRFEHFTATGTTPSEGSR